MEMGDEKTLVSRLIVGSQPHRPACVAEPNDAPPNRRRDVGACARQVPNCLPSYSECAGRRRDREA